MVYQGNEIQNQRLTIETEHLSELEPRPFVNVKHKHGDDSITQMRFTPDEWKFLQKVLNEISGTL